MKNSCNLILDEILRWIGQAGLRQVRARTVAAGIQLVQGLRYLLLLQYVVLMTCFLSAFSLFFSLYLASLQWSERGTLQLNWPLGVCAGLFVVSTALLIFSVREKTWIRAFQIEALVDAALKAPSSACGVPSSSESIQAEAVAKIVEQVLERKLQERFPRE